MAASVGGGGASARIQARKWRRRRGGVAWRLVIAWRREQTMSWRPHRLIGVSLGGSASAARRSAQHGAHRGGSGIAHQRVAHRSAAQLSAARRISSSRQHRRRRRGLMSALIGIGGAYRRLTALAWGGGLGGAHRRRIWRHRVGGGGSRNGGAQLSSS